MAAVDLAALALAGGLLLAIVWLVTEIERLRSQLEPLLRSGLFRALAAT